MKDYSDSKDCRLRRLLLINCDASVDEVTKTAAVDIDDARTVVGVHFRAFHNALSIEAAELEAIRCAISLGRKLRAKKMYC